MQAKLTAEAVGTFALVFAGAGAITVDALHGGAVRTWASAWCSDSS